MKWCLLTCFRVLFSGFRGPGTSLHVTSFLQGKHKAPITDDNLSSIETLQDSLCQFINVSWMTYIFVTKLQMSYQEKKKALSLKHRLVQIIQLRTSRSKIFSSIKCSWAQKSFQCGWWICTPMHFFQRLLNFYGFITSLVSANKVMQWKTFSDNTFINSFMTEQQEILHAL